MSQAEKGRRITLAKTRHGHSIGGRTPEYRSWMQLIQRCTNPRNPAYSRYGGRGIVVCERWLAFANFLADMGLRGPGLSIDRLDNDGNYEPGNCRWATASEQGRNQRTSRLLTHEGETLPVTAWAERLGVSPKTLFSRLQYGWPVERVLSPSVRRRSSCA